jgi:hypothetical protein
MSFLTVEMTARLIPLLMHKEDDDRALLPWTFYG